MKTITATTAIGLGDIIYMKAALDAVKHEYDVIKVNFHRELVEAVGKHKDYHKFLDELGKLFFSEPPYQLDNNIYSFYPTVEFYTNNKIPTQKPELAHLLCKGIPLNLNEPYIVMTTKIRYLTRNDFNASELWAVIKLLSVRHKIVILGEREVEMNCEYQGDGPKSVYSIYNDFIANIPSERLIDLTIPFLGVTSPSLSQIQQDCLLMRDARFTITMGIGGNFCMANAVGHTIGFRVDHEPVADSIYDVRIFPNNFVTRNWGDFITKLRDHI